MGVLGWVKSMMDRGATDGRPPRVGLEDAKIARALVASFDAAQTRSWDENHWAAADNLSANAAASVGVRKTLRERSRYEVGSNSWARGIVNTLASDTVGTGPRLQAMSGDTGANRELEAAFAAWAADVDLAAKLRTMRMARVTDGESFALLIQNEAIGSPVKLDAQLIEADQITTPDLPINDPRRIDGIQFDASGRPRVYDMLLRHPGDDRGFGEFYRYREIPAAQMLHYYRSDRAGQSRGIPDLTAALPLFALLRRYSLAVLRAAETAANLAGVIYSDLPNPDSGDAVEPDALDAVEIEAGMLMTLPREWKAQQLKAEQPTTSYRDFVRQVLCEIARSLEMPKAIALLDASEHNYSSARVDYQRYARAIEVERSIFEARVLRPLFAAWLNEAVLIDGLVPQQFRTLDRVPITWIWPGFEHVDPLKEAQAQETRLRNNTTTLAAEYSKGGRDWETELELRARELQKIAELEQRYSVKLSGSTAPAAAPEPEPDTEDAPDE
jgi:lambda family phage portal protein